MQISKRAWDRYKNKMSATCKAAGDQMQAWVDKHGLEDSKAFIDYANALVMKYGQANGALACQMYDAIAEVQGALVEPAEMVELPSYGEVAQAVSGAKKQSEKLISSVVERMVKQVGADTTLKNAERDGAQFAWVPMGDTCAFCLTLASRGWQYISKKTLRNGHSEHIHANCDCQYAVRFDNKSTVEGYDPDRYLEMYENAEGRTHREKINSMRRARAAEQRRMAAKESTIWPKKKTKISTDDYKELMKYARDNEIELSGFKQYDGDIATIKQVVDDAKSVAEKYPEIISGKQRLTISLSEFLDDKDFAITNGHIIQINANAFRDVSLLAAKYQKMVEEKWFVAGTDYHSIIFHEIGHVVANKYSVDVLDIAEGITGKSKATLMEYVGENLSQYAASYADGREIIAEAFSSVYGNGKSEFALKFVEACDTIMVKGGI